MTKARKSRLNRTQLRAYYQIPTRWADNDVFGHVNNVVYYAWFDTAVTRWLIENRLLVIGESTIVGLVVETTCTYFESVAFPEPVEVGIAIETLGRSSVTYRIGVFRPSGATAIAQGLFTHVYVDMKTQRPVEVPIAAREAMKLIEISS